MHRRPEWKPQRPMRLRYTEEAIVEAAEAAEAKAAATSSSSSSGGTKEKKSNSIRAKLFKMLLHSESLC